MVYMAVGGFLGFCSPNKEFFKKPQSLRKYGGLTHEKWQFDDAILLVWHCNS